MRNLPLHSCGKLIALCLFATCLALLIAPAYAKTPDGNALVIDPSLTWSTFLGGSGYDSGWAMAVDPNGNVYVTGYSTESWGSPIRPYTAGWDCFVAKLAADGTLLWNTFLGGSGNYEYGQALAVDPSGNVYVTGGGDGAWGSPLRSYTGGWDCFVAKLTPDGALLWNTFLGAGLDQGGRGITADPGGNVFVTGYSEESWDSPIRAYTANDDAFVAKLAPDGTLLWNTFLGGSGNDSGWGMTVDTSGNVFVAGESGDAWGSPQRAYTANDDAFAAKLAPDGTLVWNTFLGGAGSDYAFGIAVDPSGFLYVAGQSYEAWGSPVRAYEDLDDTFVARLARDGTLTWNTFLGGSGSDCGFAIAVDPSGFLYVAGHSDAAWGWPFRPFTGSQDAFAARLAFDGTLAWNTFLGGNGWDGAYAVAVDSKRGVSVAGSSWESWGAPKRAYSGRSDVFVARILDTANPCTYTATPASHSFASSSGSVTVTVEAAGAERCLPPAVSASDRWIDATLVSFQENRGTVEIAVAENGVPARRAGTVTVENSTFAVNQEGAPCGLAIAPNGAAFAAGGGEDWFIVTAAAGCRWTVEVEPAAASWLGASPKAWSGTGGVNYIALENFTGRERTGRITVSPTETPAEKREFTVTQGKY